jgi:hypothetical protein
MCLHGRRYLAVPAVQIHLTYIFDNPFYSNGFHATPTDEPTPLASLGNNRLSLQHVVYDVPGINQFPEHKRYFRLADEVHGSARLTNSQI